MIELPKLARATDGERADEAALVKWSQFLAANTDEAVEAAAMGDPVLDKAKSVLERVSSDPMAKEAARLRELARINWKIEQAALREEREAARREGREEGREEGAAEALRGTIVTVCATLGIPLDESRRATLAAASVTELNALFESLFRERAWPV